MPDSNLELTRRAFEAIEERGLDAALEFMDPEVEFEPPEDAPEGRGVFKGHEAVRDRWDLLLDPFGDVRLRADEFVEADAQTVIAVFRIQARGRASGAPVEMRVAHLVTVRDGKAIRIRAFLDPDQAKRAAGLDPQRT